MIGKIIKGNSFRGCVSYVLKKNGAEIINANIVGDDANEYARELEFSVNPRPNRKNKVCHIILSLPIHEKLDDETWMNIFDRYLENMGFTNNHYMAVKHTDREHEHAHIITNQVRLDGSVVSYDWEKIRSQEVIRGIEKDFGLTQVRSSWESDSLRDAYRRSSKTKGQLIQESKTGTPLIKTQIADRIDAALAKSTNMCELIAELDANQVSVRISRDRSGKPSGISYKLDDVSVAGSRIGRIYSLSQVLKRLENGRAIAQSQDKNILPLEQRPTVEDIPKAIAIAEIPAIILANVRPNMTMPELVDRLKESGVDVYVKYTRTKKVKGISFSVGNDSIAGNELGKEFSFAGLQKYLDVSFDPERDNSKLSKRSASEVKLPQVAMVEIKSVPTEKVETKSNELAAVKPILKNPPPQTVLKKSPAVSPILKEQAYQIVEMGRNVLEAKGKSKHDGNYYHFESEGNMLTIRRAESQEIILQVTDQIIEINNLTILDVERFNIAVQAKDEDRRTKDKQIERDKVPDMDR